MTSRLRTSPTTTPLMSGCNSDWQFYEHLNMKRILEDPSQDTGDGFIVYMYGGNTQN